jgi:hypothetical protein
VDHRHWGVRVLHEWQVKYASKDAFLSFEIANQLEIKHGYRFLPDANLYNHVTNVLTKSSK